jgi:hypothetical protein
MVWPGVSMVPMGTGHEKLAWTCTFCSNVSQVLASKKTCDEVWTSSNHSQATACQCVIASWWSNKALSKRKLKLAMSCVLVWSVRPFIHYLFLLSGASQCVRTNSEPSRHCAVKCTVQTDCGNSREKCLCDGDCGYSCVIPSKYISRVSLKICNRPIAHDVTAPVTMHLGDKLAIYA